MLPRRTPVAGVRADAVSDLTAITPGVLPFGLTVGIVIGATRMGDLTGLLGAPLVYGGSAQLTAATMFDHGAGVLAVVGAALTVNARLLLYGAALAPRFEHQPRWFQLIGPHMIIDQTYLAALRRPDHAGRRFRYYWLCLGLGLMAVWTGAVATGLLLGPLLPTLEHLSLAPAALFIGMLVPRLRDRSSVRAAVTASVIAPVVALAVPSAALLTAVVAGLVAARASRREESS
jgi:predicted branched-subunit amino acid permease